MQRFYDRAACSRAETARIATPGEHRSLRSAGPATSGDTDVLVVDYSQERLRNAIADGSPIQARRAAAVTVDANSRRTDNQLAQYLGR